METGIMRRIREGKSVEEEIREGAQQYALDSGKKNLQCAVDPDQTKQTLPRRIVLKHGVTVKVNRHPVGKGKIWIGIAEE